MMAPRKCPGLSSLERCKKSWGDKATESGGELSREFCFAADVCGKRRRQKVMRSPRKCPMFAGADGQSQKEFTARRGGQMPHELCSARAEKPKERSCEKRNAREKRRPHEFLRAA
jgi:hypothetical protein